MRTNVERKIASTDAHMARMTKKVPEGDACYPAEVRDNPEAKGPKCR